MISGAVEEITADADWATVELDGTMELLVIEGWTVSTVPVVEAVWAGLVGLFVCFFCLRRQAHLEGLLCCVWVEVT